MLLKKDLIEGVDAKYIPMLEQVDICDFTKCIAQFAGLDIQNIPDRVIKSYLLTWAEHKYEYFKMLGNQLHLDTPITYCEVREDIRNEIKDLKMKYPTYAPWLGYFNSITKNKIEAIYQVDWTLRDYLEELFPHFKLEGSTMTKFFKQCLNAPDELVTDIGRIFENTEINGTYTLSIDPVDMMLASENPYNWNSCYRLTTGNCSSHADGCLAAVLDTSSLIGYLWTSEGKMNLYNYKLKNVRYKRMRQWISIAPDMDAIHFNIMYPSKSNTPEELYKQTRLIVETIVCSYTHKPNFWNKKNHLCECTRCYGYGYTEYYEDNIYTLKNMEDENYCPQIMWEVFDTRIPCPCGCGCYLPGSYSIDYEEENEEYNGEGFICENYNERYWCEYVDDYCSVHPDDRGECSCRGCWAYDNTYPLCELDQGHICEDPEYDLQDDGVMHCDPEHCKYCPMYKLHHPDVEEEEETEAVENTSNLQTVTVSRENTPSFTVSATDLLAIDPHPIRETIQIQNMVYHIRGNEGYIEYVPVDPGQAAE